ncbi:MAG: pilin [bacterium]
MINKLLFLATFASLLIIPSVASAVGVLDRLECASSNVASIGDVVGAVDERGDAIDCSKCSTGRVDGDCTAQNLQICRSYTAGGCSICDIVYFAVSVVKWLFGILGAVTLFFFIWNGFKIMASRGDSKKYGEGLNGIKNTGIGLAIIFGAWQIVNLTTNVVTKGALVNVSDKGAVEAEYQKADVAKKWSIYCDVKGVLKPE